MKFRDDIDPANTWVISDTHFGHDNIVGFCFRPDDHDQVMIAEWRAHIPDDATVLHLGDLCYGHNGGNTRFRRLTSRELTGGRKLLIQGNHDNKGWSFYRDCGFRVVRPFSIVYGARKLDFSGPDKLEDHSGRAWFDGDWWTRQPWIVSFSHYAWNEETEGRMLDSAWRIHGHIHNNGYTRDGFVPFLKNHINVSVEQTKYRPVNLKLLLDAAILGVYPATTDAQLDEARERRDANLEAKP